MSDELNDSKADFNIIVNSIQVLSNEHGSEVWGSFRHEVDKLKEVIADSNAEGVILLSRDCISLNFRKRK